MNKILTVDLSKGIMEETDVAPKLLEEYLGGRGLGARLLYDLVPAGVDPLGPDNVMIFAVGPLTATKTPTAGRSSITTKSPLTNTILDSNCGGTWGANLRKAGYLAVIVKGKAAVPMYLEIGSKGVKLHEAEEAWGLNTLETTEKLSAGTRASVACIGPAGENLVHFASITVDAKRSFGRGGVGAVMGSKNLKAIVVSGDLQVPVAQQDKFDFINYETSKLIKSNPITAQSLPEFGTAVLLNLFNEAGILPTRNFQQGSFIDANKISGESVRDELLVKRYACYGCPIGCGRVINGIQGLTAGPEYETVWSFGAACGIGNLALIAQANTLCNLMGLDTISTGGTIACAMELKQKGLLDEGPEFGQETGFIEMIEAIAHRQGLGAKLALGSKWLAEEVGDPFAAMQVKGMELPAYDPRGMQGQGLGFATSNRGGCHLRGNMMGPEILGAPKMVDRYAHVGKAGLLIVKQHTSAVLDSLVLCKFISFAVDDEYFARLLSTVMGLEYEAQDLQIIGERIWNLERLFNLREGFTKEADTLPSRLLNEPLSEGPTRGKVVNLEPMLVEYYRFRSWDINGVPTQAKLKALHLEGI
jgi:aldehyde:ferredoxin oxidoreductase